MTGPAQKDGRDGSGTLRVLPVPGSRASQRWLVNSGLSTLDSASLTLSQPLRAHATTIAGVNSATARRRRSDWVRQCRCIAIRDWRTGRALAGETYAQQGALVVSPAQFSAEVARTHVIPSQHLFAASVGVLGNQFPNQVPALVGQLDRRDFD